MPNEFCWKAAKELGLIIVPGDSFDCPGYFRISYCVPTELIEKAIPLFEKLLKVLKCTSKVANTITKTVRIIIEMDITKRRHGT